ncbi:carbohydrate ABC transporter substrate-binding protein, CUT1 family [Actinacidiphila yanglinensis]|uniref:Carbohydrate ABC transporter substrate-binding protein, CUT1 family n=1 Tax=Actinacidiphila yanglinensis TaxID=310779 RepID=A0A1H6E0Z2_9ACTN|nr:extracellular solute-binding protein [Actinacidiphila yanglinensis]SEG90844.1 carbohydrate ABC transporter substrate-binding protein, CUT1 family [Actinacidiphila yanglinensis]
MSTGSRSLPGRGTVSRRGLLRVGGGVVAATALPSLLTACGGGGSGGKVRIVGVADEQKPITQLLAAYRKSHPDFKASTSFAPTDDVQTVVRTQLAGGNAPDIHVLYPGSGSAMSMVELAKAGLLADLSDMAWTKTIPKSFDAAYRRDGKTYLYSAGSSIIGAIYNKKVFADAGVKPPTTWSELLDVCATLKAKGIIPIALGAQTPWVTQLITYALVPNAVYAKDPTFDDEMAAGRATFADSGWADAMGKYLDLQKRGFFNDHPDGTTYEQQTSMVATGKAAMAVQVSSVLSVFRAAAKNPDDLSMFPFPGGDDPAQLWIPAGIVVGLGVSARAKNATKARQFIEFLGTQENLNAWTTAVSAIPLQRDSTTKLDPALSEFLPIIDADRAVPFMDQRWPNAEVQPAHFAAVQDLLAGKTDVKGALTQMDKAYGKKS